MFLAFIPHDILMNLLYKSSYSSIIQHFSQSIFTPTFQMFINVILIQFSPLPTVLSSWITKSPKKRRLFHAILVVIKPYSITYEFYHISSPFKHLFKPFRFYCQHTYISIFIYIKIYNISMSYFEYSNIILGMQYHFLRSKTLEYLF